MCQKNTNLKRSVFLVLLVAFLLAGSTSDVLGAGCCTYSGQAIGITAKLLGITTTASNTGGLSCDGGSKSTNLLSGAVGGPVVLTTGVLSGSTVGQNLQSDAQANVNTLNLLVGGTIVSATVVQSNAHAKCVTGGPEISGSSVVTNLAINGNSVTVSGSPNQTVQLPGLGKIVINSQGSSLNSLTGSITVKAIRIVLNGLGEIAVAQTHADITCVQPL